MSADPTGCVADVPATQAARLVARIAGIGDCCSEPAAV